MKKSPALVALCLVSALGLSACGSDGDEGATDLPAAPPKVSTTTPAGETTPASGASTDGQESPGTSAGTPTSPTADAEPAEPTGASPSTSAPSPSASATPTQGATEAAPTESADSTPARSTTPSASTPSTTTQRESASPTPSTTASRQPTTDTECADTTVAREVALHGDVLDGMEPQSVYGDAFDPCADLSAIVVSTTGAMTGSHQVLLFHRGEYLGTSFATPTYYQPGVHLEDDRTVRAHYQYAKPGEPAHMPTGQEVIRFTWDGSKVVASGVPHELR